MTLTEAINPISVSSEIERKTENDGQLCPDKVFLQLHHREMWPDHKKPLPCAPALEDVPDARQIPRKILDRETVDEMVYNTPSARDRLIVGLQARCVRR